MLAILLTAAALAAEPSAEQVALLKTFRGEFIAITPGEGKFPRQFTMGRDAAGAESPAHTVTFARGFQIAKYEVPQNLWEAVVGNNPSEWKGVRNSVEKLSFDEAVEFCQKITVSMRVAKLIAADEVIRLPSEAEWEYVARAGTTTRYSFGDDVSELGQFGWFTGNAKGNDPPVGAKQPNAWGLYDVHGYLWEWCSDTWHDDYRDAPTDGSRWATGGDTTRRVARSGSWKDPAEKLTSSFRRPLPKETLDSAVGLRCVLSK